MQHSHSTRRAQSRVAWRADAITLAVPGPDVKRRLLFLFDLVAGLVRELVHEWVSVCIAFLVLGNLYLLLAGLIIPSCFRR